VQVEVAAAFNATLLCLLINPVAQVPGELRKQDHCLGATAALQQSTPRHLESSVEIEPT
jgi:hypothetical protein